MIVYSTKYALSQGIVRLDVEQHGEFVSAGMLWLKPGRDAFLTFEEAQVAAQKMLLKRVNSLEKQVVKLKKLKLDAFKDAV